MRARIGPILSLAVLLGLTARAPAADAGPDVSPFLPVRAAAAGSAQAPDGSSYELRGIMSTEGGMRFCIYDPAKKSSSWVAVNEQGHNFTVMTADPAHDSVTVQAADGRRLVLGLRAGKVAALNQGGTMPPPVAAPPLAGANSVLHPTPEDNQRRLQSIAEEVRRRRMMRERAQQNSGPNVQPHQ